MRYTLSIILLLYFTSPSFALKPIVAVSGVNSIGLGMLNVSKQINNHLINVMNSTRLFSIVNPEVLNEQLEKYQCIEEKCVLAFAKTAGIDLLLSGTIDQGPDSVILTLYAYGIKAPYFGRVVNKYRVKIPVAGLNAASNYIMEEHAGRFISDLLEKYKSFTPLQKAGEGNFIIDNDNLYTGRYKVYRFAPNAAADDDLVIYDDIGEIELKENKIVNMELGVSGLKEGDFIFLRYREKAEFLKGFYDGLKREMVFLGTSYKEDVLLVLATAPSSALMPVISPLAYYKYGDYSGLALWAVNSAPYMYIEYRGLTERPDKYRENKRDLPQAVIANYRFGLYFLACGGMSVIVDSFARQQLYFASNYQPRPSMGNTFSAVYLSLFTGGGGHFYRGYRLSGYLYFHLHNILLYSLIKEFSPAERYDPASRGYKKDDIDRKRAYSYLGAFALLKIIEITHVILRKDNVASGEMIEDSFLFEPSVDIDGDAGFNYGVKFVFRI